MPASRQRALELLRKHQATASFDRRLDAYTVTYWKGFACKRAKALIPARIIRALIEDGLAEELRRTSPKDRETEIVFVQITKAGRTNDGPDVTKCPVELRLPYID